MFLIVIRGRSVMGASAQLDERDYYAFGSFYKSAQLLIQQLYPYNGLIECFS